jgi:hypothetical protein
MNPWQRAAIESPALLAEETMRPRFGHRTIDGTLVLSVNSGYE